ncbi:unnamed protein product [Jaminaea pallidilutea]
MASPVRRLLLTSDSLSPNSSPHGLPALFWPGLTSSRLGTSGGSGGGGGPDAIRSQLRSRGWEPQWTFPMFKQAHYHSTTHELLCIISGSATLLLGGSDAVASNAPPPPGPEDPREGSDRSATTIDVAAGDALLLPAGYAHRAVVDHDGFRMIGSYPANGETWDMCYPSAKECSTTTRHIEKLVRTVPRKGLGEAQDPSDSRGEQSLEELWLLGSS